MPPRLPNTRRSIKRTLCALVLVAGSSALAQSDSSEQQLAEAAPNPALHFSLAHLPEPVEPAGSRSTPPHSDLWFSPAPDSGETTPAGPDHLQPLRVLSEMMLARSPESAPEADAGQQPPTLLRTENGYTLRFEDAAIASPLLRDPGEFASAGSNRWELLPDVYLRSGRVHDAGYESIDYADLYAELGVDLSSNTGLWLRYERLRQALGQQREGEQVDADALYLQFELRF
ncbi:MAG: hypothetical protein H6813_02890 [Phycisphaeraceae bacterium]|nr:hypothetical protein [Phycisphaeraceae bacterium]MCB9848737.1 hypothetical protein [Phycisphaeraceae bacterium]